jgi:hypothetical protein
MRWPTSLSSDQLTIYLNDHLAGSTFGLELARRALSANRGNEFEAVLEELTVEIGEDRRELERIFDRLAVPRDRARLTVGWFAEKVGRLKPNGRIVGYSPLSRLLELEGLSGGIRAKLDLWRALQEIAPGDPRLDDSQLDRLIGRAESQLHRLASTHARAADLALGHPRTSTAREGR